MTESSDASLAISRICTECGVEKPLEDFSKRDGGYFERRAKCKKCMKIYQQDYSAKNKEKNNERSKKWIRDNPIRSREKQNRWRVKNLERAREQGRRKASLRRSTAKGRLEDSISSGVNRGIVNGSKHGRRTFETLGYTRDELYSHLEAKFKDGMSFDNYGDWHIDHIVPLSAHNYETPDDIDFKRAWALENLQPLWKGENLKKSWKLNKAFQPSLLI
jgi:hypothetical protein